ncbi:hypothetical protein CEP52_005742 [Fusarium oligoseptatum]|uniref:Uncharacterized protein n=1 Tax=Fusarium oligoseptatum TaxID=2604345 RepID=A0A428TWK9_9HYPO|nr:hypothetical protein CEP52_005742 [Fusarium oligoseptatum]
MPTQQGDYYAHLPNLTIDWDVEDTLEAPACRVRECWLFPHSFHGKDKLEKHFQTSKMRQLNANHRPTTHSQGQNVSVVMPRRPVKPKASTNNRLFRL